MSSSRMPWKRTRRKGMSRSVCEKWLRHVARSVVEPWLLPKESSSTRESGAPGCAVSTENETAVSAVAAESAMAMRRIPIKQIKNLFKTPPKPPRAARNSTALNPLHQLHHVLVLKEVLLAHALRLVAHAGAPHPRVL